MSADRVIDWIAIGSWQSIALEEALAAFAPERDLNWLSGTQAGFIYWDDPQRLEPLRTEAGIHDKTELTERFAQRLYGLFDHLRAVHLCRPIDFGSYWRHGVRRMNPRLLQEDFCTYFRATHPELTETDLVHAIDTTSTATRVGLVYLGLDQRFLLSDCGHYASYGSEYQIALAVALSQRLGRDYRQSLKLRGRPAVVTVQLPIDWLDESTRVELADWLLRAALWAMQNEASVSPALDFGVSLDRDVPAEMILKIEDAPGASDPFVRDRL